MVTHEGEGFALPCTLAVMMGYLILIQALVPIKPVSLKHGDGDTRVAPGM